MTAQRQPKPVANPLVRLVASVASFFVSRMDVAVDALIEDRTRQPDRAEQHDALNGLRGEVAIASAKLAYQRYKRLFAGPRRDAAGLTSLKDAVRQALA